jgi:hypothetical protein
MRSRRTPSVPVRRFPDGLLLPLTLDLPLRLFHGEEFFSWGAAAMAKGLKCFRRGPAAAHILGQQPGLFLVLLPGGEFLLVLPGGLLAVMPFKHPTHPIPPSWWRQAGAAGRAEWPGKRPSAHRSTGHGRHLCWPHLGLTAALNADNCCALPSNVLAGQRFTLLVMRADVYLYGSEGWGFESLRARQRTTRSQA